MVFISLEQFRLSITEVIEFQVRNQGTWYSLIHTNFYDMLGFILAMDNLSMLVLHQQACILPIFIAVIGKVVIKEQDDSDNRPFLIL